MKFLSFQSWLNEMAKNYSGETFTFLTRRYNIERAMELIRKNPDKYKAPDGTFWEVPLEDLKSLMADGIAIERDGKKYLKMGVTVKPQYAMEISDEDLQEPGIFVNDTNFNMLIDGWHRAYRKLKQGDTHMNVYVIDDPKDLKYIREF